MLCLLMAETLGQRLLGKEDVRKLKGLVHFNKGHLIALFKRLCASLDEDGCAGTVAEEYAKLARVERARGAINALCSMLTHILLPEYRGTMEIIEAAPEPDQPPLCRFFPFCNL
jgi:hypothetical protein